MNPSRPPFAIGRPAIGRLAISRRSGLMLGLMTPLVALVGCSPQDSGAASPTAGAGDPSGGPVDPGGPARQADLEADLVARYDAVLAAFPTGSHVALLAEFREHHLQHAAALGGPSGPPAVAAPVASTIDVALSNLAQVEREQSRSRLHACVAAQAAADARLLAFVAAAEAAHVPALLDARAGS